LQRVARIGNGTGHEFILGGEVRIQTDPVSSPNVIAGKAKLLAVLGRERRRDFPNVPLLKEIYPTMDYRAWFGIFALSGTRNRSRRP
jgi:tripartite-type tricarboxylate transporter receptor subunit TctC